MTDHLLARLRARLRDDSGVALITVITFVLVAGALGTLVAVTGVTGLRNATRDNAGAAAQATSDAGVAEAMSYIRANGITTLTCMETPGQEIPTGESSTTHPCKTNVSWANYNSPQVVVPGLTGTPPTTCAGSTRSCYLVWIGTLQHYAPGKTPTPALLMIHSTGFSGSGPGARAVDVEVSVVPDSFPFGVYGDTLSLNGNPMVQTESIFAVGNISIKCPVGGFDYEYGIPASVHAAGTITYGPGNKCGYQGPAHPPVCNNANAPAGPVPVGQTPGETIFDQDSLGGPLKAGDGCYGQGAVDYPPSSYPGSSTTYPTTSLFTANDLASYGYQPGGLSSSEYAALKSQAQSEGTYFTTSTSPSAALTTLASSGVMSPVVYYDFPSGSPGSVSLSGAIPSFYTRSTTTATTYPACQEHDVVIVVRNGSVDWNASGGPYEVSLFVPEGSYSGEGSPTILGTLFAQNVTLRGSHTFQLDPCAVDNPPAGILSLTVLNYRPVDTGNLQ